MHFEVVSNQNKWNEFLESFEQKNRDVYFSYHYVKAHEKNGDGIAKCATFEGNHGMKVMYPFIVARVPDYGLSQVYYDISSAYGYGGPLVEKANEKDIKEFEEIFHTWCKENNIIAEFIRFHPVIENHKIFKNNITVEKNRDTILLDMDRPLEEIWSHSITSKNRNQIRKAQKSGVEIRKTDSVNRFIEIYNQTMKKLEAGDYFYFNDEYYKELLKLTPENITILEAVFEEKVIAASIFIHMGENMHYHLSGSISEYRNLCPNNLMIFQSIEYGMNKGLKKMHLGGGTTGKRDDSLLKFKSSFSKDETDFFIGKRIYNKEVYNLLIKKWEDENKKEAKILLQYRD